MHVDGMIFGRLEQVAKRYKTMMENNEFLWKKALENIMESEKKEMLKEEGDPQGKGRHVSLGAMSLAITFSKQHSVRSYYILMMKDQRLEEDRLKIEDLLQQDSLSVAVEDKRTSPRSEYAYDDELEEFDEHVTMVKPVS